jgi:purine-binding chemotaxis protein CheW
MMSNKTNLISKAPGIEEIEISRDDDFNKRILRERAFELAKPKVEGLVAGKTMEGLCLLLSDEQYIIDSKYVVEVLPLTELTPLPCTPPFVLGIINVRGRILSVVNLKNFLNLPDKGITNLNRVIVVKNNLIELGILADEVVESKIILIDELQQNLSTLNQSQKEYLLGVTPDFSVVFHIEKFLSDEKIIVNEEV